MTYNLTSIRMKNADSAECESRHFVPLSVGSKFVQDATSAVLFHSCALYMSAIKYSSGKRLWSAGACIAAWHAVKKAIYIYM